jgi:hypothetical protein
MRIGEHLRYVLIALAVLACSSSAPRDNAVVDPVGDPGKAPSEFGSNCLAELIEDASNTMLAFEECTVSAGEVEMNSTKHASHIFFTFRQLPQGARRMYVSLVVDTLPLAMGAHNTARAGAVEATLEDGRTFSAGDVRQEGAVDLVIEQANTIGDERSVFYLTGSFEARLQNSQNPSSAVRFRARINQPMAPVNGN